MQIAAIVISLGLTVVTIPVLTLTIMRMTRVVRAGGPAVNRTDRPLARTVTMFKETFLHTRMLQWTWVGIMHWFVYLAFIFLSTAVLQSFFQIFDAHFAWPIIGHWYPYEWFSEIIGLLSTIGIIYLIAVRQFNHPRRLQRGSRFYGSTFWQAYFVEVMALLEGAAILFIRGAEYRLLSLDGDEHGTRAHFPLASWLGDALYGSAGESGLENIIYAIAAFKIALAMIWLLVIARNITMGVAWHRFTAWPNIWFKRESDGGTALGGLKPLYINGKAIDMESMEEMEEEDFEKLGVGKVEDFSWKGLLDFTTCTECGRCQSQCPAWNTEKPLSPKLLMMGLREHAYTKIPLLDIPEDERTEAQVKELERPLIGDEEMYGVIDPDVLWSCTNCGACVQQCPVDIEHVDHIDDMRRFQVLVESNFPAELNNIFKGLERKGNPWGMNSKERMAWAKDLDFEVKQVGKDVEDLDEVEWLFWVGCAGAFEDRAKKTTQAVAELLNTAGVDFAVLGDGETCTGDPARRAGNEIVFMQLAMENVEVFKETKVKKVVSTCAHCFNTLKNEYKEFGIELEVVHHTQLLNRLVREGKLKPVAAADSSQNKTITYHDPCFLGRHNQVYEAPRELLEVIPGAKFAEMPRNSERSFCCGAGGARMWMEENLGSRINVNRTQEAVATGADQIAVGCPFCRVMLSDGLTAQQAAGEAREEVEVLDVAQMLLAAVKREPAPEPSAEDDAAVVAEAEQATATAATAEPTEAVDKATEAEPDADDRADDETISDTAEAGALAGTTEDEATEDAHEELDDPDEESAEQSGPDAAAENNISVNDAGLGHGAPDVEDEGPAEDEAKADEPKADADEPEAKADEPEADAESDVDEPEATADEPDATASESTPESGAADSESTPESGAADGESTPVEAAATEEEDAETDADESTDGADEAQADHVEAVEDAETTDPAGDSDETSEDEPTAESEAPEGQPVPDPEPEPGDNVEPDVESVPADDDAPQEAEPAESDAPAVEGENDPREAEADTVEGSAAAPEAGDQSGSTSSDGPTEVVAVEDAPAPDPVSDDAADLTDANPSGAELSSAATSVAPEADEVHTDDAGTADAGTEEATAEAAEASDDESTADVAADAEVDAQDGTDAEAVDGSEDDKA